jgi:hypothetical protein
MAFILGKRDFDDDDSYQSSCPDSPTMFPLSMTDVNGDKKLIFNEQAAQELDKRVRLVQQQALEHARGQNKSTCVLKGPVELQDPVRIGQEKITAHVTKKKRSHGLAPKGMCIPVRGDAFRVGGARTPKQPLKESSQEKYNRIKSEQEKKRLKKNQRDVKRLKKEGKVGTLAPFMFS